ncbi:MAG: sugar transferase [Oscillospiraceae bacterium]|jgi:lipopolysaccharide/colanic/teichoic acid biosynthesis glycosyltransferase|nr:sugar transferase [Oscillospiraceae bacterium]
MYFYVKRFLDIFFSTLAFLILSPIFLLVAVAIKVESPGPVLFWQERLGKNGKVFKICKFRSMVVGAEKMGSGVYSEKHDPRVFKVGRLIRMLSIDELPQLFCIIRGDMSIIGPRPPLTYHPWTIDKYTDQQREMFAVLPGVTGWTQVHGRKTVEWNTRIEMNVWYVKHISFWLDMKIFFMTIVKIFKTSDNVNYEETVVEKKDSAEK